MRRRTSLSVTLATLFAAALWLGFPPIGAQTHRRPPDGSEHRLRGVCGPGVGGERNARRLRDGGRRQELDALAEDQPSCSSWY